MFEAKNLLVMGIFAVVITIFGYMLLLMVQPDPYPGAIAAHAASNNGKATSQILAMIQGNPKCGKLNIPRDSLLKYYKSQECFMLKTEIQKHRRPTDAELLNHGNEFITGLSSKLKMCMLPEKQHKLMARIEPGKNLKAFLDEIDRSKGEAGKLDLVRRKMNCTS